MNQSKKIKLKSDNTYDWRGDSVPVSETELGWSKTFYQRRSFLAKKWNEYDYHERMTMIEQLVYYSSITSVRELSNE